MRLSIVFTLIIIGFTSTLAQIMLLREMAVVFYGNELFMGVFLAFWLFWTGIGSLIPARWADKLRQPIPVFISLQTLVSIITLVEIFIVRYSRGILGISHGVTIGPGSMLLAIFSFLMPLCLLTGFLFVLGCRVYALQKEGLASPVSQVYLLDALGDVLAGLCFTYGLVYYLHSFQISFYLIAINLLAGLLVLSTYNRATISLKVILSSVLVLCGLCIFLSVDQALHRLSKQLQWQGYKLIDSQESIYGNVAISQEGDQYSLYENNLPLFSIPNQITEEELVHLSLVQHPHPEEILIIGGGIGLLKEVVKHRVARVYYLDLDPLVTRLSQSYLTKEDIKAVKGCHLWYGDARFFVKRTRERFDLMMINLPDASTAQLNRFYTREFFLEVKRILTPDGVICLSLSSNENYLSREMKDFNACIYKTLKSVFPYIVLSPGDHLFLFASPRSGVVTDNPSELSSRFIQRGIKTNYVSQYYFATRFYPERVAFIQEQLETEEAVKINWDFLPVCYYYDLALWSSQFHFNLTDFASKLNLNWLLLISGVLLLLQILISIKKPGLHRSSIPLVIAVSGFSGMALEIVLLFSFQVLYGYLYHRLGIIVAAFMLGLVIGTGYMKARISKLTSPGYAFCLIEALICVYSLGLPLIFSWLSSFKGELGLFASVEIGFPLLTIIIGLLVGLEFPLANQMYLSSLKRLGQEAGAIYAADLFGACAGALLVSILLIPILGIFQTCYLTSWLNLLALIMIWRSSKGMATIIRGEK